MSNFLVIGGGISGCTAGFELAEQGHQVQLIEQSSLIGGKVLDYCCKATDECSRCGVCVAHTRINDAIQHPNVTIHTGITIDSVTNNGGKISIQATRHNPSLNGDVCNGCDACVEACPAGCITKYSRGEVVHYAIDYDRCLLNQGKECDACLKACTTKALSARKGEQKVTFTGDGVLLSTGHEAFQAENKPRYGYGRNKNVFTGEEAEKILTRRTYLTKPDENVAFIQCVGSRDPLIGRNYCSAVCCSYALRLAKVITYRNPDAKVTVYYIDIQNFDKNFTLLKQGLIDQGVHFVRGLPFKVDELANGKLKLLIEDGSDDINGKQPAAAEADGRFGADTIVEHDAVVLSVGLGPESGASKLAELFSLSQDEFGFFRSNLENVFITGTCKEPMSIPDSMTAARAVAFEMGTEYQEGTA